MESPTAGTVALGGKHPLQNRWSMWYFKNDKAKDWKSNQRLIASCDTVEVRIQRIERVGKIARAGFGKNFEDDTDLLFLSGFPVWAKL